MLLSLTYAELYARLSQFFFFFFSSRRRHTRLSGDWSSDVCSSDLSSTLAWKIPWMEEPGRLQSMGSLSQTPLSNFTFTFRFMHTALLRRCDRSRAGGVLPQVQLPGSRRGYGT